MLFLLLLLLPFLLHLLLLLLLLLLLFFLLLPQCIDDHSCIVVVFIGFVTVTVHEQRYVSVMLYERDWCVCAVCVSSMPTPYRLAFERIFAIETAAACPLL